jgi:hypothetical protein
MINNGHINPGLTAVIAGTSNKNRIADRVSPIVNTSVHSDFVRVVSRRDMSQGLNGFVPENGEANQVETEIGTISFVARQRAFKSYVTSADRASSMGPISEVEAFKAEMLANQLSLARERAISTYFTTSGNFANTQAGSAWSGAGDLVGNVMDAKAKIPSPEKLVFACSRDVWFRATRNATLLSLLNVTDGLVTPEMFGKIFGFDDVAIGESFVDGANYGAAASYAPMWGTATACIVSVPASISALSAKISGTAAFHLTMRVGGEPQVRTWLAEEKAGAPTGVEVFSYDAEFPVLNDAACIITGIS